MSDAILLTGGRVLLRWCLKDCALNQAILRASVSLIEIRNLGFKKHLLKLHLAGGRVCFKTSFKTHLIGERNHL
jgi:hypothetical protein